MTAAEAQVSTPLHRQSGLHADRPGIRIEEQSPTPKTLHEKLFGGKKLADRRGAAKALGRIKATSKSSVSVAASTEPPREEQKLCRARVLPRPGLFRRVLRRSERSCRSSAARRSSRRRARWRLRGRPCHGVLGHWGPADFLSCLPESLEEVGGQGARHETLRKPPAPAADRDCRLGPECRECRASGRPPRRGAAAWAYWAPPRAHIAPRSPRSSLVFPPNRAFCRGIAAESARAAATWLPRPSMRLRASKPQNQPEDRSRFSAEPARSCTSQALWGQEVFCIPLITHIHKLGGREGGRAG